MCTLMISKNLYLLGLGIPSVAWVLLCGCSPFTKQQGKKLMAGPLLIFWMAGKVLLYRMSCLSTFVAGGNVLICTSAPRTQHQDGACRPMLRFTIYFPIGGQIRTNTSRILIDKYLLHCFTGTGFLTWECIILFTISSMYHQSVFYICIIYVSSVCT